MSGHYQKWNQYFVKLDQIMKDDNTRFSMNPVKNVTRIVLCLSDCSLVKDDTQSVGNQAIFLANAMEIAWRELIQSRLLK